MHISQYNIHPLEEEQLTIASLITEFHWREEPVAVNRLQSYTQVVEQSQTNRL